jgi:hypothetical protein
MSWQAYYFFSKVISVQGVDHLPVGLEIFIPFAKSPYVILHGYILHR